MITIYYIVIVALSAIFTLVHIINGLTHHDTYHVACGIFWYLVLIENIRLAEGASKK